MPHYNLKAVLFQTMKNYDKLKHYDYSKRLVSQVEFTLMKFFHLYINNSVLNNDEFISYDNVHKLHHKSHNKGATLAVEKYLTLQ